ncbi:MAG: aspartate aminotransferase family protein [Proteobacteria bacterium]|nr:aspartate aminotransferase family protein [Pseudomonadota bacterium]
MSAHLMNTYKRLPVAFVRGEGAWLWDESGKRYLDALAGIAVNGLGHAHPKLVAAIADQAAKVIHTSNIYRIVEQEKLGEKLAQLSGMDNAFFNCSGAEANETAIKLARLYGHQRGIELPTIVVMDRSWHGRTIATLSATGNRKAQAGFEPLLGGFARVPFNDLEAVNRVAENNANIVAVLVEPVQGEGGIQIPEKTYLSHLRELCDRKQWLFMLDEVQSGMGRTGKWFAYQHTDLMPDVLTLAKGLANGMPIGACVARGAAANVFSPGNHGTTFGGGALICRAALTTLEIIEEEGLLDRARVLGDRMVAGFRQELAGLSGITEIRGAGLMLGIELDRPCNELVAQALEAGLLINVTYDNIVRMLPPLVISDDQADQIVSMLSPLIRKFLAR